MSAVELVRGCYFTNWAIYRNEPYKFTPEKVPLDLCTHVFYAFAALNAVTFEAQPFDPWADIDLKQYEKIANLKKQKPGIKSILSFGGWTMSESGVFEKMATTAAGRATFSKSAYALANKYGFDGMDLDWEYPNAANKANFVALLKRSQMKKIGGGGATTTGVTATAATKKGVTATAATTTATTAGVTATATKTKSKQNVPAKSTAPVKKDNAMSKEVPEDTVLDFHSIR